MIKFMGNSPPEAMWQVDYDALVIPVNTVGTPGAGVALQFSREHPPLAAQYVQRCADGDFAGGGMFIAFQACRPVCFCLAVKEHWRQPSEYPWVDLALQNFRNALEYFGPIKVNMPAIGCGRGGLDWARVSRMICERLSGVQAQIRVFNPPQYALNSEHR
jgi:hypothetical protein